MTSVYHRVLVPVTGTPGDRQALSLVADMACRRPIEITLVYVVEVQQAMPLDAELPDEIDCGERALFAAEQFARSILGPKQEMSTDLLQARSAGAAIVDEAIERQADAIVVSTSNRNAHGKVVVGGNAAYIVKNAPCDVIMLREFDRNGAPEASHK